MLECDRGLDVYADVSNHGTREYETIIGLPEGVITEVNETGFTIVLHAANAKER